MHHHPDEQRYADYLRERLEEQWRAPGVLYPMNISIWEENAAPDRVEPMARPGRKVNPR